LEGMSLPEFPPNFPPCQHRRAARVRFGHRQIGGLPAGSPPVPGISAGSRGENGGLAGRPSDPPSAPRSFRKP
jgi:hypothetical protein